MSKVLRPEHLNFFTARMEEHDRVVNWEPIPNKHEYLFRITRNLSGDITDVIVHLTDAYLYTNAEFIAHPRQLRSGSFVVLGMPHAGADPEVVEMAREHRIGIGHIGKFMGALTYRNIWEYMTPDERQDSE